MPPNGMLCAILAGLALSSLAVRLVQRENETLHSLVDAERAFSRRCGEVGFRQSFLDYFAADGVIFTPSPRNCVEALSERPAEAKPAFPPFEWAPATADVSEAGDLGYTTGPVRYWSKDGSKPIRWGTYFSVWQRSARGEWKVVLDFGTEVGDKDLGDPAQIQFRPAPDTRPGRAPATPEGAPENGLLRLEEDFARRAVAVPMAQALIAVAAPTLRVHRDRFEPAIGSMAVESLLHDWGRTKEWKPLGSRVSRSGDLGYTYGRYELEPREGVFRTGFWAHVWRWDRGRWRLVLDVANQS